MNKPNLETLFQNGIQFFNANNFEKAKDCFLKAIEIDASKAGIYTNLASTYQKLGQIQKALENYEKALKLKPDDTLVLTNIAKTFFEIKNWKEAAFFSNNVLKINPHHNECLLIYGDSLRAQGEFLKAAEIYKIILEKNPDDGQALRKKSICLERLNRLDEALDVIKKVIEIETDEPTNHFVLAKIDYRKKNYEASKISLKKAFDLSPLFEDQIPMHQLLGRVYDELGDFDKAFEHFEKSNQMVFEKLPPFKESAIEIIGDFKNFYHQERILKWKTFESEKTPVFLVGFPRSGTTLLDNILNSHPDILVLEEKPTLKVWIDLYHSKPDQLKKIDQFSKKDIQLFQKKYWEQVYRFDPESKNKKVVVDKLPLNILYLGMIYRIFPNAKIITALRHPADCCLSCFIQNFEVNMAMINFLNLKTTVDYYATTMDLYFHYKQVLNLKIYENKYEDLIENFEDKVKEILNFIECDWNESILKYRDKAKKRQISTPSYHQVIEPLYKSSIYKWKNYQKYFEPYLNVLKPFIEKFGY